jgi:hypothetical protein
MRSMLCWRSRVADVRADCEGVVDVADDLVRVVCLGVADVDLARVVCDGVVDVADDCLLGVFMFEVCAVR